MIIDFLLDNVPLEVSGVSLVKDGIALFPDAHTECGVNYVNEIIANDGIILFSVVRKTKSFTPNMEIDPNFSEKLIKTRKNHIKIIAV